MGNRLDNVVKIYGAVIAPIALALLAYSIPTSLLPGN
jgi:hypothetical protein